MINNNITNIELWYCVFMYNNYECTYNNNIPTYQIVGYLNNISWLIYITYIML